MKDATRYKVTVTAIIRRDEDVGGDWQVLETAADGSKKHGRTPNYVRSVEREVQVLEQRVDDLDVPALVCVINGIKGVPA